MWCERLSLAGLALLLAAAPAERVTAAGPDPLFASDAPLAVTIEAPLDTLVRERPDEEELAGVLRWIEAGGEQRAIDVAIRTRGNFRRNRDTCPFPPLRLNVRKSEVAGTLFDGQDKIKLVTHCRTGSHRAEQAVLREYLAYRMLNALTELSYRVRLLEVTWRDAETDGAAFSTFAFLIESSESLAARTGLPEVAMQSTSVERLDPAYTNLVSVFQYLLGNTDFSPIAGPPGDECCHNTTPFGDLADGIYPVPYDFDMSGLVDAEYAVPNPRLKIRDVRTRVYRGRCINNDRLDDSAGIFLAHRDELYALLGAVPALDARSAVSTSRYLDSFFADIGDPARLDRQLARKCIR